jgi:hypothetical protein
MTANRFALTLAAAVFATGAAAADSPAVADAPTAGLTADQLMERLEQNTALERRQTELAKAKAERDRAERELGVTGPAGAPVLMRVVGTTEHMTAYFAHGGGEYPAKVGDTIGDGFQVRQITSRAARVVTPEGKDRWLYLGSGTPKTNEPVGAAGPTPITPAALPMVSTPPASAPK